MTQGDGERVGLVLAGAAARGPYQAGALSVLLPALHRQRRTPVVLLGTSSGAITAALVAQFADLAPADAATRIADIWTGFGEVFRNPLCTPGPTLALGARLIGFTSRVRPVDHLLDVTPLRAAAGARFAPDRIVANLASERVESLAVAATWCPPARSAARSRLFVQGRAPADAMTDRGIDVVEVPIELDHLLASAAIPALFPPVRIEGPGAGWYVDGGLRLNAPFGAALALGVDRIVVIAAHAVDPEPAAAPADGPPDIAGVAALSVRSMLADGLADDLASLRRKNRRPGHKVVPHLLVAPRDGELAGLAAGYRPPGPGDEYWAIVRLLGAMGATPGRDELLSLMLFERGYAQALVAKGRADAEAALAADWQT